MAPLEVDIRAIAVTAALNVLTLAVAGFAILMSLLTLAAIRLPQLAPVWAMGLTRGALARALAAAAAHEVAEQVVEHVDCTARLPAVVDQDLEAFHVFSAQGIETRMRDQRISFTQLAAKTGISRPTLYRLAHDREANPGLQALLVINQLEPRTRLSQVMRDALAELSLPAAQSAISRRMIYKKSVIQGRSVLDVGSQGAASVKTEPAKP